MRYRLHKKIIILNNANINQCIELISQNYKDNIYFQDIGWGKDQYLKQIIKNNNFSLGVMNNKQLIGFILGDLIIVENTIEYEILLLYIETNYRKKGYATFLIENIVISNFKYPLNKIILEVNSSNKKAINLYEKNFFQCVGVRKNYYKTQKDFKDDALLYERYIK